MSKSEECTHNANNILQKHSDFIQTIIGYHAKSIPGLQSDADDILQAFYLKLMTCILPKNKKQAEAYLYAAILNHTRTWFHRKSRQNLQLVEYCRQPSHKNLPRLSRTIVKEESNRILETINQCLPQRQAQALLLRFQHDLDDKTAAQRMNVSQRTYSHYICTGLKQLRHELDKSKC